MFWRVFFCRPRNWCYCSRTCYHLHPRYCVFRYHFHRQCICSFFITQHPSKFREFSPTVSSIQDTYFNLQPSLCCVAVLANNIVVSTAIHKFLHLSTLLQQLFKHYFKSIAMNKFVDGLVNFCSHNGTFHAAA